ncbi:hypothetical protein [Aeromicrobium choanae]|uniref:hypothetical protein n=1 Tax=Aeromicrobium choanae TaxID=1736691 RepID=UPI00129486E3|nr:hypothetical protein [Aeromicrobium choanae]
MTSTTASAGSTDVLLSQLEGAERLLTSTTASPLDKMRALVAMRGMLDAAIEERLGASGHAHQR